MSDKDITFSEALYFDLLERTVERYRDGRVKEALADLKHLRNISIRDESEDDEFAHLRDNKLEWIKAYRDKYGALLSQSKTAYEKLYEQ